MGAANSSGHFRDRCPLLQHLNCTLPPSLQLLGTAMRPHAPMILNEIDTVYYLCTDQYKSFKQLCKAEELTYEPKMLKAVERATKIDQLEIFLFRKEFDKAVEVLAKLLYPHPKYGDDRLFRMIAKLESKYPNQVLEFHRKGLGNVLAVGERAAYAGQARAALRMRHIWLDVLKTPEAWQTCAKNVKALTLKKPAFQQEFAKTIPDWKER